MKTLLAAVAVAALLCPRAARAADTTVAVVPFQGLGAEPALIDRLAEALREQVGRRHFTPLGKELTQSRQRAAAMCGEDVECLGTLGQRLEAQYVVAFGLGRVGDGAMFTALVVDVAHSKKVADYSERLPGFPDEPGPLALRAVSTLFVDLTPAPNLLPSEPPPPAPLLSAPAVSHTLRPWAIGVTIGAGVLAIAGAILTVLAQQSFARLPDVSPADRPGADSRQRTLNGAADATVITFGVAAAAALTLFLLDGPGEAPAAPTAGAAR